MKTNMINTNSVIKSICAVVMLLGMSVSAWGAKTGTLTMSTAQKSPVVNNGVTFTWSSANIVTGSGCGFKGKAGTADMTITIPTGCTLKGISKVNSGSTWGSGAGIKVYTGTNTSGTLLTTIVTGTNEYPISSNNTGTTYYLVNNTGANAWINSLSITYGNAAAYKVTFDAEGGTCATSSLTEAGADAGVTLPAASPSASMASMGWGFYGWAESAVSTIASSATIVGKAGDTYYPNAATTLHAVYAKGTYTVIKSTSEITSGEKYLIGGFDYNNDELYIMTDKYRYDDDDEAYYMSGQLIGTSMSETCSAADVHPNWRYIINYESGKYFIKNNANTKYIDVDLTNWVIDTKYSSDYYTFTINSSNGYTVIKNNNASKYLVLFVGGDFGRYTSDDPWDAMLIYKETETPTYCSNPSTVRLVASPAVGGSVVFDDNSSAEMDFATADGYIGDITATPNDGYDFLNWVSSDEDVAIVDAADDPTTELTATESATITAHFYQKRSISYILTEGGVAGEVGNPTTVTKDKKDGFVVGFNLQAHYKDMTLVSVTMGGSPLTEGAGADYEWEVDGGTAVLTIHHDNIDGDIVITVSATPMEYTKYAFSCAELTLTPKLVTASTPIFITSAANKTVRSQDTIQITGTGLTPSTTLTFPGLPSKFAIKKADGTALATQSDGTITENAFIFYTPGSGDTSDGLDELTGITVSVEGAKPKTVVLEQDIIGRHLPADFVIAGKKDGKWYALPADFSEESTPAPIEIAVDDINNPGIAYTANTNIYNLYGQNSGVGYLYNDGDSDGNPDGEKIKLGMKNNGNKPLFAFANPSNALKGDGTATVTNNIGKQYWWTLKQTNTSIDNPQDAKYTITSSNNPGTLSIKNSPFAWGTYKSGVEELRLIPASDIVFTEAYFVEWGQHGGVIEVDAEGIDATSVVAHLNGVSSSAITLVQTKASDAKNKSSKYNYTVNFGGSIDFAAAASNGALLTLEWKNGETVKAVSNIVVPKIVATSNDMKTLMSGDAQWETEVHVLPGVTLTANGGSFESSDVKINLLEIYPGATIKVTTGTLNVASLVLRNGWTRVGSKSYDVARLYVATTANLTKANITDGWYSDWYIDYDQYYPIAVPFPVATNRITYKNTKSAATAGVTIRYYDGARRAENEQQNQDENWVAYTWGGTMPANLEPSKGYALTAKRPSGKAFSIVRMPMTFTNPWTALGEHGYVDETHKDQVSVTGYGKGTASWYAMGWNFVGNPYMSIFNEYDGTGISGKITTQEGGSIKYATIPDLDFQNYYQVPIAEANLKPASGFFIQADNASPQTITFNADKIVPPSAPARYTTSDESVPEQEAYIRLSNGAEHDLMGLIIGEDYTEAYEPNADLAKLLGEANAVKTYMHYADMDMAYVAINATLAQEWIPVTVNIPAEGEYTFSITNSSTVDALEGIYLIDYQNGDHVTNLIENDYVFTAAAGTISDRFAINAIVGQRETPTDIDIINAGGDIHSNEPVKFIWNDKVFILHRGVIYDSTGKRVREINR